MYLNWRRRFDDWLAVLNISLAAAHRLGVRLGEGITLANLGNALAEARRSDEAITACQDAVAIFRETSDQRREGMTLANLGNALFEVRRFDEAITACQDAAAIFRETSDQHSEGMTLNSLGNVRIRGAAVRRGHHRLPGRCRHLPRDQRPAQRRHDPEQPRQRPIEVRRFDEAITACQDAAAIFRETSDQLGEDDALEKLARAQAARDA